MLKAVAIDDEPLALKIIETFCERAGIKLEKSFTGPSEGLKYINRFPVNLVFLDIQMPSMTGIDFARQMREDVMVIFTTAFDNFALKGYNLNAIDYLLKPFTYERFLSAIEKADTFYKGRTKSLTQTGKYINVRVDYNLVKIQLDGVEFIEALDDYVKIHTEASKVYVVRSTLKSILALLPPGDFIRVHRSFVVPIKRIISMRGKSLHIKNKEIPIGQKYIKSVLDWFREAG